MSAQHPQPAQFRLTRRQFLQAAGQVMAGGALSLSALPIVPLPARPAAGSALPTPHPNLLFIVTDQERTPRHWGSFDLAANLPARQRLLNDGLSFERAYCNAAMCSPSRATLLTGYYPPQHGLTRTLTYNESDLSATEVPLASYVPNMAHMLASAGYHVALKGKWHLSKNAQGDEPDADDVLAYGFQDWTPTTAGEATAIEAFGGGCAQNDAHIVDEAVAWLSRPNLPEPFALFVMLANPHDVLAFPKYVGDESCSPDTSYASTADWSWGIDLPATFSEDLEAAHKPSVQQASLSLYNLVLGSLDNLVDQKKYINFYAYLHTQVDQQIGRVLDALDGWSNARRPVIIRTADHGEMGLAHGGLRQKMFNTYEETTNVPLIISHPGLPHKGTTQALASLVDILPTVASLAGVPNPGRWAHSGVDLTPVLNAPTASVQDTLLFTFDDDRAGTGFDPGFLTATPIAHHIRSIRCEHNGKSWKFARYFNPAGEPVAAAEFELYCLSDDPLEQTNLYDAANPSADQVFLAGRLAQVEAERLTPLSATYLPALLQPAQ